MQHQLADPAPDPGRLLHPCPLNPLANTRFGALRQAPPAARSGRTCCTRSARPRTPLTRTASNAGARAASAGQTTSSHWPVIHLQPRNPPRRPVATTPPETGPPSGRNHTPDGSITSGQPASAALHWNTKTRPLPRLHRQRKPRHGRPHAAPHTARLRSPPRPHAERARPSPRTHRRDHAGPRCAPARSRPHHADKQPPAARAWSPERAAPAPGHRTSPPRSAPAIPAPPRPGRNTGKPRRKRLRGPAASHMTPCAARCTAWFSRSAVSPPAGRARYR